MNAGRGWLPGACFRWRDPSVSRRAVMAGAIGGIALSAALPTVLRRRLRS